MTNGQKGRFQENIDLIFRKGYETDMEGKLEYIKLKAVNQNF